MARTLGGIIKDYRTQHSLSMDAFAKRAGISKAYISMLENNKNPRTGNPIDPSLETYIAVSNATGMTIEDLLIESGNESIVRLGKNITDRLSETEAIVNEKLSSDDPRRYVRINVYGKIPAGIPIEAIEDVIDWEDIPEEWCRGGKEFFALQVVGDSMAPDYLEDDTIICEVTPDFHDGDDCVVYVNGYDATLKRCFHKGEGIQLQPVNSVYPTMIYKIAESIEPYEVSEVSARVLGVVREIRRRPNRNHL